MIDTGGVMRKSEIKFDVKAEVKAEVKANKKADEKFDNKIDTEQDFQNRKKWLFKEQIRLEDLRRNLEEDRNLLNIQKELLEKQNNKIMLTRKQLESQKVLFENKWSILERETRRLAVDQQKFDREKLMYKDKVYREARKSMSNAENVKIFFKGVEDTASLKKRYKSLLKIYHPDNMNGDKELLQAINQEYETLLRFYIGT